MKTLPVNGSPRPNGGTSVARDGVPARLHAILARRADKAVVFRRGPSSKTAVIGWDLATDAFSPGQWFYGSFYPYRCDLSPDGRHLVYFAAKYGRTGSLDEYIESRVGDAAGASSPVDLRRRFKRRLEIASDAATAREKERQIRAGEYRDCSWTAISRVPFLKALDLWFNGTGWNGGGLFVDDRRVAVNHPPGGRDVRVGGGRFAEVPPPEFCEGWGLQGGECPMVYLPRLVRDGWTRVSRSAEADVLEKPLPSGLRLRKRFHYGPPGAGHGCYWESHAICDADGNSVVDGANWSWADFDKPRRRVVLAEGGALFALRAGNVRARPEKLGDFNGMKYERIPAPY